jgi:DNA-binding response OmpR family regulator
VASVALKVLVVEDDSDAATVFKDALAIEGHDVTVAIDGATAIAIARSVDPDVVVLDLELPDHDGDDVARELRAALSPEASIIVVTDRNVTNGPIQRGIDLVVQKPVEPRMFASLIEYARAKRDLRRQ